MTNVQECIDLYLADTVVTDAQFRAIVADAHARDAADRSFAREFGRFPDGTPVDTEVAEIGRGLVLLNRVDNLRRDQIGDLERRIEKLTGFCDSLAGQVRVLRERLDNMEGK